MQNEDTSLQSSPQLALREQSRGAVALSGKQIISLYKKSEQSGIPFDTLKEVYERGYSVDLTEQSAYNRVNSFIAGGAAASMDNDLVEKRGLWDNIHAKRERIKHGSGEHMRKPGSKGAPTDAAIKASQNEDHIEEKFSDEYMKTARQFLKLKRAKQKAANQPKMSKDDLRKMAADAMKNTAKLQNETYTGSEPTSKNMEEPASRFTGTTELTNTYKGMTPGYSKASTVKRVVKEVIGNKK